MSMDQRDPVSMAEIVRLRDILRRSIRYIDMVRMKDVLGDPGIFTILREIDEVLASAPIPKPQPNDIEVAARAILAARWAMSMNMPEASEAMTALGEAVQRIDQVAE